MDEDLFISSSKEWAKVKEQITSPSLPPSSTFAPAQTSQLVEEFGEEGIGQTEVAVVGVDIASSTEENNEKAKKFFQLMAGGKTPGQAAKEMGTTLKALKSRTDMLDAIRKVLEIGGVKEEIKRETIRAGLFKVFVEGITSADEKHVRLALDAAKQMAADPQIGLLIPDMSVSVNLGTLGEVLGTFEAPGGITNPYKHIQKAAKEDADG